MLVNYRKDEAKGILKYPFKLSTMEANSGEKMI